MYSSKNISLTGADNKPITLDIFFNNDCSSRPVVIYAHGFNGFKDWGNFDLIAKKIAVQGYVFVKFNFSHNGTTPEHPDEFTDLEAFGNNRVCHGILDTAVPVEKAYELHNLNPCAKLFTIESDHVFGRKHPWELNELPAAMEAVVEETLQFLDNK